MTGADTPVYTSETYTTVNKAFGAPFTIQVDGTYELRIVGTRNIVRYKFTFGVLE